MQLHKDLISAAPVLPWTIEVPLPVWDASLHPMFIIRYKCVYMSTVPRTMDTLTKNYYKPDISFISDWRCAVFHVSWRQQNINFTSVGEIIGRFGRFWSSQKRSQIQNFLWFQRWRGYCEYYTSIIYAEKIDFPRNIICFGRNISENLGTELKY